MKVDVYRDKNREWRWRARALNGKILAVSSESYKRKAACMRCLDIVLGGDRCDVVLEVLG